MNKLNFKGITQKLKKINNIEYFIFALSIAIAVGLIGNVFSSNNKVKEMETSLNSTNVNSVEDSDQEELGHEERLGDILSKIKGAGEVDIMITYKTSNELVPAMNTVESNTETEEQDSNGGIRKVTQTDINAQPVSLNTQNGSEPLITSEIEAEIKGVLIVAQGANDIRVKVEIQRAVQTVLGVQANQVEVFAMEDNLEEE